MGIWENMKKFTQPYAEDEYDDYDEEELGDAFEEPAEERPTRSRRTPAFSVSEQDNTASASGGFKGQVVPMSNGKQEVVLFHPVTYNDASKAADDLRNKKAVIVNMENVDKAMARRVVDFLTGCAYAIDGKVKKVAQSTYLFCPHNMDVQGDLDEAQSEVESYV